MTKEEFSLLFHRAQVNLVAFKQLYEPEAFEAMQRMVEMAINEEREACAKIADTWKDNVVWEARTAADNIGREIRARGNNDKPV